MSLDKFKKHQSLIITIIQTVIVITLCFFLTAIQCKFNFKNFDFVSFAFNFILSTSMKMIYTNFSKNKALLNEDIIVLRKTILKDKKIIFSESKNKDFEQAVLKRNDINKLEAIIDQEDNSKKPNLELRKWAFNYLQAIKNNQDILIFEEKKSLKSIKIKYENINPAKLFTYGLSDKKENSKKYSFNHYKASASKTAIPTLIGVIMSILLGSLRGEAYLLNGTAFLNLFINLFSIGLGAWWGLNNGKEIIEQDYNVVLNNVASLIREIKQEIGVHNDEKIE